MRQRGFGWIEIVAVLVAVAVAFFAIRSVIKAVSDHDESIRKTADKAGYDRALKETAQRDKKELEDAQTMIAALALERDTQAALHAEEQAKKKRTHDKEMADAKAQTADLQRRIASGEFILRDPGRPGEGGAFSLNPVGGGRGSEGSTVAAAANGGGQTLGLGLSKPFAQFLVGEADRADEVAKDLELCWGIARDDRKRAGSSP